MASQSTESSTGRPRCNWAANCPLLSSAFLQTPLPPPFLRPTKLTLPETSSVPDFIRQLHSSVISASQRCFELLQKFTFENPFLNGLSSFSAHFSQVCMCPNQIDSCFRSICAICLLEMCWFGLVRDFICRILLLEAFLFWVRKVFTNRTGKFNLQIKPLAVEISLQNHWRREETKGEEKGISKIKWKIYCLVYCKSRTKKKKIRYKLWSSGKWRSESIFAYH